MKKRSKESRMKKKEKEKDKSRKYQIMEDYILILKSNKGEDYSDT